MFHLPQRRSPCVPFNMARAPSGWTRAAARRPGEPRAEPTAVRDGSRLWEVGHLVLTCVKLVLFLLYPPLLNSCHSTVTGLPGTIPGGTSKRKLSLERHQLLVSSLLEPDNLETPKLGAQHPHRRGRF